MEYFFICAQVLGIVSSIACLAFIIKLQINHVVKKLLIFATVQQAIGYGTALCSVILSISGLRSLVTCFLGYTVPLASVFGTQTCISAIGIIRYCTTSKG